MCGRSCAEPEDCGELGSCVAGFNCLLGLLWVPEGQCMSPSLCPYHLGKELGGKEVKLSEKSWVSSPVGFSMACTSGMTEC